MQDLALGPGRRSSALTTRAAPASRRAFLASVALGDLFTPTPRPPAWFADLGDLGPARAGRSIRPCRCLRLIKNTSQMFMRPAQVVKAVTHEDVSFELGGAATWQVSGVALLADDEASCLRMVRTLLSYLLNNMEDACRRAAQDDPARAGAAQTPWCRQSGSTTCTRCSVPWPARTAFWRSQEHYAENVVIALARLDGAVVSMVANSPAQKAGVLVSTPRSRRPFRAFLRRLQHRGDLCGRAGLYAGQGAGLRSTSAMAPVDLRLHCGDRAQADGYHPQGLRWCVHRQWAPSTWAPT